MKISYYRNKADKLMQQALTAKYPRCEICGKPVSCMHHYHAKASSSALRYDEDNLISVCSGCHLGFHSMRAAEYNSRIIAKRGLEWSESLLKRKSKPIKATIGYYKEIIKQYDTR